MRFFSSKCSLEPEVVPDLLALSEHSDIDILIVVQTVKLNIPGSFIKMSGYGLITEPTLATFSGQGAFAFAHISATVIYMRDPTLIGWYALNRNDGRIDSFNFPDDMENVPAEEINKAERPVKILANSLVRVLEKELFGSDEISREIEISKKKKRIKCTPGVGCKYVVE